MTTRVLIAICLTVAMLFLKVSSAQCAPFERQWVFASETSAVIYWQLGDISQAAFGLVEYGADENLGSETAVSLRARWSQLHHLTGLDPDQTYYYRMVSIDSLSGMRTESEILSFQTVYKSDAIRVPGDLAGPPYVLDQPGGYYMLTEDITTDGTAVRIDGDSVTLDLDGHTITFGNDTDSQVFGVQFVYNGPAILCNGFIVQGERSGLYSCAIRSSDRPHPREVFGISTDVHIKCAYPMNILRDATGVRVHHNHFYSRVTDLESRHYPGNAILQMNITGGDVEVYDNLLTEGCHRGIALGGDGMMNVTVHHNDIQHHQQYVNGYAIIPCENAEVYENKVSSTGRAMHLNTTGVLVHDNYIDIQAHQHRDDLPQNELESNGADPDQQSFNMNLVEAHGIKFEGSNSKNCTVYNNYVRIVQHLPRDSGGHGLPENKRANGVYVNGVPTSSGAMSLVDETMSWQRNRWRYYLLRYSDAFRPTNIGGNGRTDLQAYLEGGAGEDYTIYQKWQYVPPTPLNIACYDPSANNEVYGNTFIAITKYETPDIWHGGYGTTGNWGSPIMFVGMDQGAAPSGHYSISIHDNTFVSNDLFMNSYEDVNMTVLVENNRFDLVGAPHTIEREGRLRGIGLELEAMVNGGDNEFNIAEGRSKDVNGDGKVNIADALAYIILLRRQPDSPAADWNVDGRVDGADPIDMLKDIVAAHTGAGTQAASSLAGVGYIPTDSLSSYTSEQLAEMEASGRDGL